MLDILSQLGDSCMRDSELSATARAVATQLARVCMQLGEHAQAMDLFTMLEADAGEGRDSAFLLDSLQCHLKTDPCSPTVPSLVQQCLDAGVPLPHLAARLPLDGHELGPEVLTSWCCNMP